MTTKFKIGDRVSAKGKPGTIVSIDASDEFNLPYLIKFDAGYEEWVGSVAKVGHDRACAATKKWIVAVLDVNGKPRPSERPCVHSSAESAKTEADRLANKNKGKTFAVFEQVFASHVSEHSAVVRPAINIEYALKALAGDTNAIISAFHWEITPEGFRFWSNEYDSDTLSDRARDILIEWIGDVAAGTAKAA